MTEPNAVALGDPTVPRVTLAGVEWPVPKLAIKQNSQLWPMLPLLRDLNATMSTPEGIIGLHTMVFIALTRAHDGEQGRPGPITRQEFDEMGIEYAELMSACLVVMAQSGLKAKKSNGVAVPLAPTEASPSLPTGQA